MVTTSGAAKHIQLDDEAAREGLDLYRAVEMATQAWQDWQREQYAAHGLDPERQQVAINPITGRIVVAARPRDDGGST